MKRFIITNLLAIMALPMLACFWIDTHNYYLFSVYENSDFQNRVNEICRDNWKTYLGIDKDTWFSFNAEEIIEKAKGKNDQLMVSYVQNLQKYLDCVDIEQRKQYEWNYPTQEEINGCKQNLLNVRSYAFGKLKSRLRSQHALLYMRCNMMLGYHQDNITFWEQTANQYIETVYKDMMKNIYAGALYKTGKEEKAGELFVEMGDYSSLMTQYYKKRSYFAIQREYRLNPNSKVLPFLLQDFVNNAQEADDATNPNSGGIGGKLFIRDLTKSEVLQMITLCDQVVREGKTQTPILWKSAKAWLEYMFGSKEQALIDITESANLSGTQRMIDNDHVLRIYITAALKPQGESINNWLAQELNWLRQKTSEGEDGHYLQAYERIAHQVLYPRFQKEGYPDRALALMKGGGYYTYYRQIDTMQVENLIKYKHYLESPEKTQLDRYLTSQLKDKNSETEAKEQMRLIELIGMKYLRLCQWEKAIEWLKKVPASYCDQTNWATYAAYRSYTVEPWIKRQWIKEDLLWANDRKHLNTNPKLDFAQDMLAMEGELNVLKGEAQKQRYYDLAVRYAQANFTGDCWWLMRDEKSVSDTVRVNEVNLAGRALRYLSKASESKNNTLKEKALFALCYGELFGGNSRWYTLEWNSQNFDYDRKPNPKAPQYRAFAALADFEKNNSNGTSQYVSRCDEYIQFRKAFH